MIRNKNFRKALKVWADNNINIMTSDKHLVKLSEPKNKIVDNSDEYVWNVIKK